MGPKEVRQLRLQSLQEKEAVGSLTSAEGEELRGILSEMDLEEMDVLRPALERLDRQTADALSEKVRLEAEGAQLDAIATQLTLLLSDAREYLQELRRKRTVIAEEYSRVTGRELAGGR